jgi:hypothetical protein
MTQRWDNYVLNSGDNFLSFWEKYLKDDERNILFIIGIGFDPRSIDCTMSISNIKGKGKKDVISLRYYANQQESTSNYTPPEVQVNVDKLEKLIADGLVSSVTTKGIIIRSEDDKHIASLNATRLFSNATELSGFSDLVVDISAMPRGIFIPLINKLLSIVDGYNSKSESKINLHVVITENVSLDSKIQDLGSADEATFIHGFTVPEQALTKDQKKVWIPLLGESQTEQFNLIRKSIEPVETCVVLPFPSKSLKRGDLIVDEYKDLLFNDNDFEPRNIVYVNESNPFHVYRLISQTIARYQKSFGLLDGCKVIISALSSKVLSLGAFMAVYEAKKIDQTAGQNVGIKQVESMGHKIEEKAVKEVSGILTESISVHAWLAGVPYIDSGSK